MRLGQRSSSTGIGMTHSQIYIPSMAYQVDLMVYRVGEEMGVDPKTILATSHGRRSIDMMKIYDPSKANWECKFQDLG